MSGQIRGEDVQVFPAVLGATSVIATILWVCAIAYAIAWVVESL